MLGLAYIHQPFRSQGEDMKQCLRSHHLRMSTRRQEISEKNHPSSLTLFGGELIHFPLYSTSPSLNFALDKIQKVITLRVQRSAHPLALRRRLRADIRCGTIKLEII